ncbi:hypothetical protein, partial [Marinobacter alexandrii]|uniref:hypothetical protein n=1 Tax=Marinobacter alexandrii TaxID=2570351 RepID=UPI00329802F3
HYEDSAHPTYLTGMTDARGIRFATWAYNADGLATLSEHAGGAEQGTIAYNVDGSRTVTNAFGKETVYHITQTAMGPRVSQVEGKPSSNCLAADTIYAYDANGYVNSMTDAEGNITTRVNDAQGRPLTITEGVGTAEERVTTYVWDATFNKPTKIERAGLLKIEFTYDATTGDQLTRTETDLTSHIVPYSTNGEVRSWAYTYQYDGATSEKLEKITVDGPLAGTGDSTVYDYNAAGHLSKVTNGLSHETTVTAVNGLGLPTSLTDENGIATALTYNERGWLTSVTVNPGASQSRTRLFYDAVGQITKSLLPDGEAIEYGYDDARYLTRITNSAGEQIDYTVDLMGNVTLEEIKASDGTLKKTLSRTFDELSRVMTVVGSNLQTTSYGYDLNDQVTTETDPRSKVTSAAYDALNRLIKVTDANLDEVDVALDQNDEVSSVSDKRSLSTVYIRNGFGEVIRRTSPDTGVTDYEYDSAGNLTQRTDARSVVASFSYDDLNRVTAKSYPGSPGEDVSYSYDDVTGGNAGIGRLTQITDGSGSTSLVYDAQGNVIQETRLIGAQSYVTQYSYTAANRLASITYPSGRIVSYTRDTLGRVASVWTQKTAGSPAVTVASNIGYYPYGPLQSLRLGNGLSVTLTRDQDYRVTRLYVTDGTNDVQDLSFGYGDVSGDAGNITSITDALDSSLNQTFTYDAVERLTQATGVYGTVGYGYDANENRTSRTIDTGSLLTETSTIDPSSNKLLSINNGSTTRSFTYTPNGNITTDSQGSGLTYLYNHENRVSTAQENGLQIAAYDYNDFGQRVSKDLGSSDITHYHYDRSGVLIGKSDELGITETEYVTLYGFPLAVIEATGGVSPTPTEQVLDNDGLDAAAT